MRVRVEKGKMIIWNKTKTFWFLFIDNKPYGYFGTKREAINKSKEHVPITQTSVPG
jgi:hypothetical protein